ncbi:MAG: adenylosuccinate synthetase, partial [Dinghuibacter sp.]|nr:adenylosuccinate synthetase [Dinghuibacter sp.]
TELNDATGELLRTTGSEFGATTGRPRRCGWIDLVALKFTCMINGVTELIMTKADVLDVFDQLSLCTAYDINGTRTEQVPFQMTRVPIEPVLEQLPGWKTDITQIKDYTSLPDNMKAYISFINNKMGIPVKYLSNGPGREQIIENCA